VTLHLIAPAPPPPDHVLVAIIRPTKTPKPITPPPPPPMAMPSLPRVVQPAIVPLLETPALPNAITLPPTPPVVRAPPGPVTPPTPPGPPLPDDFRSRLYARINAFKRYPPSALSARIQGRPVVHFVMSRQGRVLELALAQSSGIQQLDQAALAAVRDAQPLPELPSSIPGDAYAVTVGINFSLAR
jgi:protein TonB